MSSFICGRRIFRDRGFFFFSFLVNVDVLRLKFFRPGLGEPLGRFYEMINVAPVPASASRRFWDPAWHQDGARIWELPPLTTEGAAPFELMKLFLVFLP